MTKINKGPYVFVLHKQGYSQEREYYIKRSLKPKKFRESTSTLIHDTHYWVSCGSWSRFLNSFKSIAIFNSSFSSISCYLCILKLIVVITSMSFDTWYFVLMFLFSKQCLITIELLATMTALTYMTHIYQWNKIK